MKNPYLTQSFFVKSFKFDKAIIFLYKSYKAKIREYKELFFALRISYQQSEEKKKLQKKKKYFEESRKNAHLENVTSSYSDKLL